MKKTIILLSILICTAVFSSAQNTTSPKLKELDEKMQDVNKRLDNTPCNTTPKKCDDAAKAEKQKLSDEYYQLIAEKKSEIRKAEGRETLGDKFGDNFIRNIIGAGILLGVPALVIGTVIFLLLGGSKGGGGYTDSHGSATWATDQELKSKGFVKTPTEIESGNFVIGLQDKNSLAVLPKEINFLHTSVLGPSGTGKSRFFFMPNLFYLRDKASMFVHDTKGELWDATSEHWKQAIRLAPYDPDNSLPFNWIPYCTDENSLLTIDLAETIITNGSESKSSDSFWEDSEVALLAGIFSHVATTECPTPAFAYDLIVTLNLEQLIDLMRSSESKFANEQANFVEDAPDKVKQAMLTGIRRTLTWLRDEKVRRFTSSTISKPNLEILRNEKLAIYWCLPQTYSERLRPLTCLALKLLMFQLRQTKGENVYLLLDEFDALGRIPRFESDLTLLRSEKVAIIAGIQSIAQLAKNYGRESAQVIFDNLQTKITLHGLEYETAERISKNLGESTLIEDAVSTSKKGMFDVASKTVSQRKHARRLMTADEIRRLDEAHALIITSNVKPFIKEKALFNSDVSPTVRWHCGEAITMKVERITQQKKTPTVPPPNF